MTSQLPYELLYLILVEACQIDDDIFALTTDIPDYPASIETRRVCRCVAIVPLVCKTWHAIATPLAYETVVLGSERRTNLLARTLLENPSLGRYVRKLRVEESFGDAPRIILESIPELTDLYIYLGADVKDGRVGDLSEGLKAVSPKRLVLCATLPSHAATKSLVRELYAFIETSPKLVRKY